MDQPHKRQLSWRQGDVLSSETAKKLGVIKEDEDEKKLAVIITHDCDLAADIAKEPDAEIIVGTQGGEALGSDSYAKTARRLQIEYKRKGKSLIIELNAINKATISKSELFKFSPSQDILLDGRGVRILQKWLSSRYYRAAFPEFFENYLRQALGKKFIKNIENILGKNGKFIRSLLFDLDDGEMQERRDPKDPYQLGIVVLYNSTTDEKSAREAAQKTADELEKLFKKAFCKADSEWLCILLKYCDIISDSTLTIAENDKLKQWRVEHMSLRTDPIQSTIDS